MERSACSWSTHDDEVNCSGAHIPQQCQRAAYSQQCDTGTLKCLKKRHMMLVLIIIITQYKKYFSLTFQKCTVGMLYNNTVLFLRNIRTEFSLKKMSLI